MADYNPVLTPEEQTYYDLLLEQAATLRRVIELALITWDVGTAVNALVLYRTAVGAVDEWLTEWVAETQQASEGGSNDTG